MTIRLIEGFVTVSNCNIPLRNPQLFVDMRILPGPVAGFHRKNLSSLQLALARVHGKLGHHLAFKAESEEGGRVGRRGSHWSILFYDWHPTLSAPVVCFLNPSSGSTTSAYLRERKLDYVGL